MINIITLPNGNLRMSAEVSSRNAIQRLLAITGDPLTAEAVFISEFLGSDGTSNQKEYTQVQPEEVGALTSAALISDGENVYGDMDYQIKSFLEDLMNGKEVLWTKG